MSSKKYRSLTLKEKVDIIREVELAEKSKTQIASENNVPLSTLSTFLKNKDKILHDYSEVCVGEKRKRVKVLEFPLVDEALTRWFYEVVRNSKKKISLDGPLLKQKALEFAKLVGEKNFGASNGWFEKWKERNNVEFSNLSGESAEVDFKSAAEWMNSLDPILKEYDSRDIFNVDETGLFYKCQPSKTYKFKGDPCSGGKNSKERVTILVGANMDGSEKLPLLLIDKSARPHCFRHIKTKPLDYKANKKAWMTSSLFEEWLLDLDVYFRKKNRIILLLIDNCPAHNKVPNLKNIKVIFFPPNMTSLVQPMDQGVIKNLKHFYRKIMIMKILAAMESNLELKIDMLVTSRLLKAAWNEVTPATIKNCFANAGFQVSVEANVEITVFEESEEWRRVTDGNLPYIDYLNVDEEVATFEERSVSEIAAEVLHKKARLDESESEDEEQTVESENRTPSAVEVMSMIEKIRLFSESQENVKDEVFHSLQNLESFVLTEAVKKRKQLKITSFLSKK